MLNSSRLPIVSIYSQNQHEPPCVRGDSKFIAAGEIWPNGGTKGKSIG